MADEISSDIPNASVDPNVLIDRKFLHYAIFDVSDDIIDPLIGILRKYIGGKPMTAEEHAIAHLIAEQAILVEKDDESD